MQIVIDISIENYNNIVYEDAEKLRDCIRRGIVLPKGHGNLVDINDLISRIIREDCDDGCGYIDERDLFEIPVIVQRQMKEEG